MYDLSRPRRYKRIAPDEARDLVAAYRAGTIPGAQPVSIRAAAELHSVSYGTAWRLIHASDTYIRPQGGPRGRKAPSGDLRAESGATGTEAEA